MPHPSVASIALSVLCPAPPLPDHRLSVSCVPAWLSSASGVLFLRPIRSLCPPFGICLYSPGMVCRLPHSAFPFLHLPYMADRKRRLCLRSLARHLMPHISSTGNPLADTKKHAPLIHISRALQSQPISLISAYSATKLVLFSDICKFFHAFFLFFVTFYIFYVVYKVL